MQWSSCVADAIHVSCMFCCMIPSVACVFILFYNDLRTLWKAKVHTRESFVNKLNPEVMRCALISLQPHPVNNTPIIENMLRNQQIELIFKSTQNAWINVWFKFLTVSELKQRIDMGTRSKIALDIKDVQNKVIIVV